MAVDRFQGRQVACKIVNLIVPRVDPSESLQQSDTVYRKEVRNKLWREVDLLKEISHVRVEASYSMHRYADTVLRLISFE